MRVVIVVDDVVVGGDMQNLEKIRKLVEEKGKWLNGCYIAISR
jgi:adenine/guanine phosphoribosyltransferase-like PRPP-binding protein